MEHTEENDALRESFRTGIQARDEELALVRDQMARMERQFAQQLSDIQKKSSRTGGGGGGGGGERAVSPIQTQVDKIQQLTQVWVKGTNAAVSHARGSHLLPCLFCVVCVVLCVQDNELLRRELTDVRSKYHQLNVRYRNDMPAARGAGSYAHTTKK